MKVAGSWLASGLLMTSVSNDGWPGNAKANTSGELLERALDARASKCHLSRLRFSVRQEGLDQDEV